jgi:carbamoyltransferase
VYVLGISCFYHDSSACLLKDGEVIAAAQEERFSREKNTSAFPIHSIRFCLDFAGIAIDQVEHVAYFEKPFLKFARVIQDHLRSWPMSWPAFFRSMPKWLGGRLSLPLTIEEELGYKGPIYFIKHHLSHAASSFYPSGFEEAAIITADGVGEWATFSTGVGRGRQIEIFNEIQYPHSLGLLYTAVTVFLGFDAHGGEGKLMGLAGYGSPERFRRQIREVVKIRQDGSFELNQEFFAFRAGNKMWSQKWISVFGSPRDRNSAWTQEHYDLAAACQDVVEEVILLNARLLQQRTGMKRLCLAGGVTLNCVANAKILKTTAFENIFVQPAAGDAGGAVGAALFVYHGLLKHENRHKMEHAYLGPSYSDDEIEAALKKYSLAPKKVSEDELCEQVAQAIADNKAIGWFQGRMEFGPRALGNRSIIGNAAFDGMKDILNSRIKKREAFRPFAPIVLEENSSEYFDLNIPSPYMLLAPLVHKEKQSHVPAITHVDGTARVQTCDRASNPLLRKLITASSKRTGVPVIINTSFNRKGEPVVCRPEHAIECFLATQMDLLAIGSFVVEKPKGFHS